MGRVLAWAVVVIFGLAALGSIPEGRIIPALCFAGIALLALPPLWRHLASQGTITPSWARWAGAVALVLLASATLPRENSTQTTSPTDAHHVEHIAAQITESKPTGPITAAFALMVAETESGLIVAGRTNLPPGTKMLVNIEHAGALEAQDSAVVGEFGMFYAGPYTDENHHLKGRRYNLNVVASVADVQPDDVQKKTGRNWSNFVGPLVHDDPDTHLGRNPSVSVPFDYHPTSDHGFEFKVLRPSTAAVAWPNLQWAKAGIANRVQAREVAYAAHMEDAFYTCQVFIKRNLRDPDSADFMTRYNPGLVSKPSDGVYSVLQKVRAANGFGGKTISIFRCKTHLDGENWQMDDLKEVNMF